MARYGATYKQQAVARRLPPESSPVAVVARELGVGEETLDRWRAEALAPPKGDRTWTAAARLEAVIIVTAALEESAKTAWCREQGLYPSELEGWRNTTVEALAMPQEGRATPQETRQAKPRIQELEREIRRKDKALAETAALRGLSKKLSAVFGEGAGA